MKKHRWQSAEIRRGMERDRAATVGEEAVTNKTSVICTIVPVTVLIVVLTDSSARLILTFNRYIH